MKLKPSAFVVFKHGFCMAFRNRAGGGRFCFLQKHFRIMKPVHLQFTRRGDITWHCTAASKSSFDVALAALFMLFSLLRTANDVQFLTQYGEILLFMRKYAGFPVGRPSICNARRENLPCGACMPFKLKVVVAETSSVTKKRLKSLPEMVSIHSCFLPAVKFLWHRFKFLIYHE